MNMRFCETAADWTSCATIACCEGDRPRMYCACSFGGRAASCAGISESMVALVCIEAMYESSYCGSAWLWIHDATLPIIFPPNLLRRNARTAKPTIRIRNIQTIVQKNCSTKAKEPRSIDASSLCSQPYQRARVERRINSPFTGKAQSTINVKNFVYS